MFRFIFTKFIHELTGQRGKVTTKKIDLIQKASTERAEHFDHRQHFVMDGLLKMKAAASDIQTAVRLFQEVDADNSGMYAQCVCLLVCLFVCLVLFLCAMKLVFIASQ